MIGLSENPETSELEPSYYGWVIVGMAALANMVGFGLVYSYGVFFQALIAEFGWSRSTVAGAFSTYAILHNVFAFFAGRCVDRFGPKMVLAVAGFCLGLSMLIMSIVSSVWGLYFYYGVVFSVGIAATYVPVTATVSRWFKAKRGLAMGLTAAGLGAGSMVFSPLSAWLISSFGWRRSYIALGIVSWIIFIPIVKLMRKAPHEIAETENQSEYDGSLSFSEAFRTRAFWMICLSWTFAAIAMWAIMIHIVLLSMDRGMSIIMAGSMAGVIGGVSIIGRIGAGFVSDRIGRKKTCVYAFVFQLVTIIWLLFSKETWMLFLFAILFGVSSGGWAGVIAAFPADHFGLRATGSILGFLILIIGGGVAIGPYLGGAIYDATQSYDYMIIMCITANIVALISTIMIGPVKGKNERS